MERCLDLVKRSDEPLLLFFLSRCFFSRFFCFKFFSVFLCFSGFSVFQCFFIVCFQGLFPRVLSMDFQLCSSFVFQVLCVFKGFHSFQVFTVFKFFKCFSCVFNVFQGLFQGLFQSFPKVFQWIVLRFSQGFSSVLQKVLKGFSKCFSGGFFGFLRLVFQVVCKVAHLADTRHVAVVPRDLGSDKSSLVVTLVAKRPKSEELLLLAGAKPLNVDDTTLYRSVTMHVNYLSRDRPNLSYAAGSLARG